MAPTNQAAVRATGLVKRYGDLTAVDGVDLEAPYGTCLGLLGPNGAGKTTTIEILEGLGIPDAGEVEVLGLDWKRGATEIRSRIGVQLQETKLQEKLTVHETLRLFRSFYKKGRDLDRILELVGLEEKKKARVKTLSGGQHQRLALGCSLVNSPELLFLDEPTTGLDPQARRRVWEIVEEFRSNGGTVILTTHYMEEAEILADRVMVIDGGRIIAEGTPDDLIAGLGAESIVEFRTLEGGAAPDRNRLSRLPGVKDVTVRERAVMLTATDTAGVITALLDLMRDNGGGIEDLRTHRPTLDDVFLALTGKQLRDG
jgi:ABC-2 type transport system ATP-binding protein